MSKHKLKIIAGTAILVIVGLFLYSKKAKGADFSGTLDLSYVTDTQYRGSILSNEGLEANLSVSTAIADSLDANINLFAKKTFDGLDELRPSIELGTSLFESLDIGVGAIKYNGHTVFDGNYELYVEGAVDMILNPSITVFHNPDNDLTTVEGSVGHSVEILKQDISVSVFAGNTEVAASDDSSYYGVTASTAYSVSKDVDLVGGITYVDTNSNAANGEAIFFVGLNTAF